MAAQLLIQRCTRALPSGTGEPEIERALKSRPTPVKGKKRSPRKSPAEARWRPTPPALGLLVPVVLAVLAYVVVLGYPFIYDDLGQILKNPYIQSWHHLPQYFTHNVWSQFNAVSNYYRPVFLLWMLLNFSLFGVGPAGWHAASLLLHAGATALVYFLARRDLNDNVAAGFCAAIFAVHPIHVESVTWISGVTEPLLAVLFLGCVLCYRRWQDGNDSRWYVVSLLLCVLALLAKETAVMIVPTLFFYAWARPRDALPFQRLRTAARAALPFAVLTLLYLAVRSLVLKGFAPDIGSHVTKTTVLFTLPAALWFYVEKLVWPFSLSVFYPFAFVVKPGLVNFVLPGLALIAVSAALWMWARRQPQVLPACVWMLLPLLPPLIALGRFVPSDLVHDRYLYLPSIGFAMLVAMALRRIRVGRYTVAGIPVAQTVVLAGLLMGLCACTIAQSRYWSSGLLLYRRGIEIAPHSLVALHQMAALMSQQKDYPASRKYLEQALEAYPDDYQTLVSASVIGIYLRDYNRALPLLLHATEINPNQGTAHFYLGMAEMGVGQLAQAEASLRRAVQLLPRSPRIHYALAVVLQDEGRANEAQQEFLAELRVDPNSNAADKLEAMRAESKPKAPAASPAAETDVWSRILGNAP
jgi:protein O-mannosyl-transferase